MKPSPRSALLLAFFLALLASRYAVALVANDGGPTSDAGANGDAGADAGTNSSGVPLRCDGGLCDTTTGGTPCSFRGRLGTDGRSPIALALVLAAIGVARRAGRAKRQAR